MEILNRKINSKYGVFKFEMIEYPGPSPLVDIWLNETHLGYGDFIDLDIATDLELLNLATNLRYPSEDDEWA